MRTFKTILMFIALAFACFTTSVAQTKGRNSKKVWIVYKIDDKRIKINEISAAVYKERKDTFSLMDIIKWPEKKVSMTIQPKDSVKIGKKTYGANVRIVISNKGAYFDDLDKHSLLWWIKFKHTSGKGGGSRFHEYTDYMINDTIFNFAKSFEVKANIEQHFFLSFVKDGKIIYVQAYTDVENDSFYFTKQQLDEAGYNPKENLVLRYGYRDYNDVIVSNFIIANY